MKDEQFKPYIPADKITPEFTVTSVIMGMLLAVVCRRLHQSGTRFPQTEVADEIRIRYQDHSKSETRFPAICVLRYTWRGNRYEGGNRD